MPEPGKAAAATGRGVGVGVIDSGVHAAHPHIGRVAGGVAIDADGVREGPDAYVDRLGHGTAVMAAIQEQAPDADCWAVRIFHDALKTRAGVLAAAIDWCAAHRLDVVNLSLGTTNPAHVDALAAAVARARTAGTLLVAARAVDDVPCYPGALPDVIGVGLDWECPRGTFRVEEEGFATAGYPRPIPGVPPRRNLHGISFAVAAMTGFVSLACEVDGGPRDGRLERVRERLRCVARGVAPELAAD